MELEKHWRLLGAKDKILYIMAIVLIASGIILAFLSFVITTTIATGSLIYISEAFMTAGGIFGVSIYFKNKMGEYSTHSIKTIEQMIERIINKQNNNETDSKEDS